ncbi:predicted protein [Botrytis cinerea T4]|uniref:Uncharacterized protein n=1 Tax=Botryotinia fuckeliana (strain T4) TaxID=999810 RepID=G2XSJ9_BOTF4|nr:predicted protein [Botrytis cinerea T4]
MKVMCMCVVRCGQVRSSAVKGGQGDKAIDFSTPGAPSAGCLIFTNHSAPSAPSAPPQVRKGKARQGSSKAKVDRDTRGRCIGPITAASTAQLSHISILGSTASAPHRPFIAHDSHRT